MAYGHELDEAAEALRERILETQKEIAALRHPRATDDRLMAAVGELDAIVKATEDATERILAAVESVEGTLSKLESAADSEILKGAGEALTSIYEACTFQDITGQRITKVVRTLDFIEERVQAMMAIWVNTASPTCHCLMKSIPTRRPACSTAPARTAGAFLKTISTVCLTDRVALGPWMAQGASRLD